MTESKESKRQRREELISSISYSNNLQMTNSEKAKMEVFASCLEDLEDSIDRNSESSQSLATKVYYLNWALVVATVVGTIIAIATFIYRNPCIQP